MNEINKMLHTLFNIESCAINKNKLEGELIHHLVVTEFLNRHN